MLANIFKKPEILNKETHKDLKLSQYKNYEFTKNVHLVPIGLNEMLVAMKSLIVVFVKDENHNIYPCAILGSENGKNLLLNEDYSWKQGSYIPAALRCYPFGLGSDEKNTFITIDVDTDVCKQKDGNLIVQDQENLTKEGEHAVNFVTEVYAGIHNSQVFCKDLENLAILKQAEIKIELNGEDLFVKNGIYIVDESSLNKLESRKLKKLATSGYMRFMYAHLLSLNNSY